MSGRCGTASSLQHIAVGMAVFMALAQLAELWGSWITS
jgi:hypothetical protein